MSANNSHFLTVLILSCLLLSLSLSFRVSPFSKKLFLSRFSFSKQQQSPYSSSLSSRSTALYAGGGILQTTDFKTGLTLEVDNKPCRIVEFSHSKQARQSAITKTKLRNMLTGTTMDKSFRSGEKIAVAPIEKFKMVLVENRGRELLFKKVPGIVYDQTGSSGSTGTTTNENQNKKPKKIDPLTAFKNERLGIKDEDDDEDGDDDDDDEEDEGGEAKEQESNSMTEKTSGDRSSKANQEEGDDDEEEEDDDADDEEDIVNVETALFERISNGKLDLLKAG
jgi:hypothetical protein